MLVNIKGFNYGTKKISIELVTNENTSLNLDAAAKPLIADFKLVKINGSTPEAVAITEVNYETGTAPTTFDGLFKIIFNDTNVSEGDILILEGATSVSAPFSRIYNSATIDTGLGQIAETAETKLFMVAPNHNHTQPKQYNLKINKLTEQNLNVGAQVIELQTPITVNGISVLSVKLTKVTVGDAFNKGANIEFKVTFHSDAEGTSVPLNFDGASTDYLALALDLV